MPGSAYGDDLHEQHIPTSYSDCANVLTSCENHITLQLIHCDSQRVSSHTITRHVRALNMLPPGSSTNPGFFAVYRVADARCPVQTVVKMFPTGQTPTCKCSILHHVWCCRTSRSTPDSEVCTILDKSMWYVYPSHVKTTSDILC